MVLFSAEPLSSHWGAQWRECSCSASARTQQARRARRKRSIMEGLQGMTPVQQQDFLQHLESQQRKDSLAMYNNLVFRCFDECSKSFRSKRLDDGETKCINVCAEKYIKLTSRVALRFQDIQQQKAKDEAAGVQR